jgi:hypothetical protein
MALKNRKADVWGYFTEIDKGEKGKYTKCHLCSKELKFGG